MGRPFTGSINLSKLLAQAKAKHSAFSRAGKNNDIFVNVTLWENDEADQFGNTRSMHLNPRQGSADQKIYFCNLKPSETSERPLGRADEAELDEVDDLPF